MPKIIISLPHAAKANWNCLALSKTIK